MKSTTTSTEQRGRQRTSESDSRCDAVEGNTHGRNKWAILVTVLVMTFMSTLDSSIVNVALPVMQKSLGVGLDAIQWVASIYLIAICATLLIFGRLGDLFGKVRVFQLGVAVFSIGSLLCGLSSTFNALMASRALQGIGAAAGMSTSMGIITESFPARERGRALGFVASFVALGMMCGPVLGGVIVSALPWDYIFLINVPVGVISLMVGFKTLPRVRPDRSGKRFDAVGAMLLAPGVGLALCSITLIEGGFSWGLVGALALGAALLICFVVWEGRAAQPLAQLQIFRSKEFDLSVALTLISFIAIGATEIVLPFYLQDARGFNPSMAGLLFAVIPIVNALIGPLSGAASDRIGSHIPTTAGLAAYAVGIFAVGTLTQESPLAQIICFVALMSLGTSMFQSPNNALLMGSAPADALGFVGSVASLAQNMGMALGISGGMAMLYGQMSVAAGKRVTSFMADRPDIFFFGYLSTYSLVAVIVALGAVLAVLRWRLSRRDNMKM